MTIPGKRAKRRRGGYQYENSLRLISGDNGNGLSIGTDDKLFAGTGSPVSVGDITRFREIRTDDALRADDDGVMIRSRARRQINLEVTNTAAADWPLGTMFTIGTQFSQLHLVTSTSVPILTLPPGGWLLGYKIMRIPEEVPQLMLFVSDGPTTVFDL